ncbi:hypothetical protein JXJ21_02055 [candidate division KSB1 bacterium]|nr:hypothetical protein [candidate division KSB1 bacterium]
MNTGQTLLTIGALILLSIIILNINRSLTESNDLLNQTRFGLEAIALASSLIEEASQLPFDEVSWDSTVLDKKWSDFTLPDDLGADLGETDFASFDDFDDFHNYAKAETTAQNIYQISCKVNYAIPIFPDFTWGFSRTYYKKLTVTIKNTFNSDSLSLSYIHGYWYYN